MLAVTCGAQRTAVQIMTAWTLPALQRAFWDFRLETVLNLLR
jgi:hypothetical protein